MEILYIEGGKKLNGEVGIATAKNSLLPIMAGSIISGKKVIIDKVAKFSDVMQMSKILESLGVIVEFENDTMIIDSSDCNKYAIKEEYTKKVRSSIFMLGPMLSRFGKARVAYPGGCNIGNRPIDLHIKGLKSLNVKIEERHGYIYCDGRNMKGGEVHLDFPSVGATENLMMASVKIKGVTTIHNCAREPEIVDLQSFLNSMGAKVYGAGSSTIYVEGVDSFCDTEYTPMKDRIIAGTYMIACAMCGGEISLSGGKKEHNQAVINKLINLGVHINESKGYIEIKSSGRLKNIPLIETQPYPGFPTDLQNQILAMQTIGRGTSVINENLFESRFKICNELNKMGADITLKDRMAIIKGVSRLYGANVTASDLRCGAGLVLAGLVADGYTTIQDVYHIDRGYLSIEEDFCKLGAEIKRLNK
ncbi:MAG: UDP-N-acetylglucosamine 1-carboxyvinyltransferase [Clostridiales bacterium]|nr:UDP-N-acetylglucosamine 1-carboxyvinyltransferase [Clostridiales bacterium]